MNALFSQKAFVEVDGKRAVPAEAEYCGGYGKTYMFGVGKGATFMNNYVAPSRDELIGRVAGYFTYGGEMCDAARVSQYVPAFLVNACGVAVQKFRRANKTNAFAFCEGISRFYNQNIPLRQVRTAKDEKEGPGFWMDKAFRSMFMFLQRTANVMTKYLEPRVKLGDDKAESGLLNGGVLLDFFLFFRLLFSISFCFSSKSSCSKIS